MRRNTIGQLEERKDRIIAALWANSNYDEDEGKHRRTAIGELEQQYEEAVQAVITGKDKEEDSDVDFSENNPFLAPAFRAMRRYAEIEEKRDKVPSHATVGDVTGIQANDNHEETVQVPEVDQ